MKLIKASNDHFQAVRFIVKTTIETVYPDYYPKGAVDFFLCHHSDEEIKKAVIAGGVYLIQDDDKIMGTGSINGNEISRLFVLPQYQGKGYGTAMMDELERIVFCNHSQILLDASLPAYGMYVHRGYVPMEYHSIKTENGHYLCYHVMKKLRN